MPKPTLSLIDVIDYDQPAATGLSEPSDSFSLRRLAVRAILSDRQGKVCLLHVADGDYFKLPGGGVDAGEDVMTALHREILEETGYLASIGRGLGRVVQYRYADRFRQDSLCYLATITGGTGQPQFTSEELANGFEPVMFADLSAAIKAVAAVRAANDGLAAITRRELALLRAADAH
ncbi:MAG TPA: NUDIX domain-containing protein [Candidatus Saccharimonas sp.]|nr:NUDIX domain-containing protein [Candidatus Saccharimonas sp.]